MLYICDRESACGVMIWNHLFAGALVPRYLGLWPVFITITHNILFGVSRCVEALTRAGATDRKLLLKAVTMFEVTNILWVSKTVINAIWTGFPFISQPCRSLY